MSSPSSRASQFSNANKEQTPLLSAELSQFMALGYSEQRINKGPFLKTCLGHVFTLLSEFSRTDSGRLLPQVTLPPPQYATCWRSSPPALWMKVKLPTLPSSMGVAQTPNSWWHNAGGPPLLPPALSDQSQKTTRGPVLTTRDLSKVKTQVTPSRRANYAGGWYVGHLRFLTPLHFSSTLGRLKFNIRSTLVQHK